MPFKILLFLSITLLAGCSVLNPVAPTATTGETTPTPKPTEIPATPTQTPTPEVTPTETFAPMELSADLEHPGKCTYDDVRSGRLAWNVKQNAKPFPPDAVGAGWETQATDSSHIVFKGSINAQQLVSICEINDSFEGFTDNRTSYVASVAVKNPDGSTGVINYFLVNKEYLDGFLKNLKKDSRSNIAILTELNHDQAIKRWNSSTGPMYRLYPTEGVDAMIALASLTGNVPQAVENYLYIFGWA